MLWVLLYLPIVKAENILRHLAQSIIMDIIEMNNSHLNNYFTI
jgi:hypothetical protein